MCCAINFFRNREIGEICNVMQSTVLRGSNRRQHTEGHLLEQICKVQDRNRYDNMPICYSVQLEFGLDAFIGQKYIVFRIYLSEYTIYRVGDGYDIFFFNKYF